MGRAVGGYTTPHLLRDRWPAQVRKQGSQLIHWHFGLPWPLGAGTWGVYISPFPQPHPLPNPLAPHALPVSLTVAPTASPPPTESATRAPSPPHTSPAARAHGRLRFSGSGWRRDGGGRGAPDARISPSGHRLPEGQPLNL